ncbi:MAG: lipid exporter, fused ATPase and inner rane subunit MsbA [Verrucomicrobiales bacterium]|nr:lipid exporter, fused ATPase and inner rane subunit MsbA [Verrucomicrobiales bacterium]
MVTFLRKIWSLLLPYKGRLVLGIICGILGGLSNPLLMIAVKVSMEVVFQTATEPLVEIPSTAMSSNLLSPSLTIIPTAPRMNVRPVDIAITHWPATNWVATNHLTVTLDDGTNTVTSRFVVTGDPEETTAIKSGVQNSVGSWWTKKSKSFSVWFHAKLREIAVSRDRRLIAMIVMMIPLAMLLRVLFTYLNTYFMTWVSVRVTSDLRATLFSHIVHQPISFFNKVSTGELMAIVSRVPLLQGIIGESLVVIILQPVTVIGLLILLLARHGDLMLMALLIFPVCVGTAVYFGRKTRKTAAKSSVSSIGLNQQLHETFTAMRVVKAYNLENLLLERFKEISRQAVSLLMRLVRAQELPGPVIEFAGATGIALFFLFIASKTGNKPTAADFTEFVGSIFLMYAPIKSLVRLNTQLEQARTLSERMFEFLGTENTVREPANPLPLHAKSGEIHFDNVTFSYGDKPVLKDIQLKVKPGQLVAFVGRSGSGKTTLTHLLLRFYDPQSGSIRIGGTDLREVFSKDLRDQIAIVTQETILFNDTIARNIELGRPGATRDEIIAAAKHAYAHDFIMEKPLGYDNPVGEKGGNLSGGQRQRITIARAILRNAPILILDEATNALDPESERAVQAALDGLMQGRTTFCVAHRLSTIVNADLIVVMQEGTIVETGTHHELLKKQGTYHMLYKLQFPD